MCASATVTDTAYLTLQEVGAVLRIDDETARRWALSGVWANVIRSGRKYLVPETSLRDYLAASLVQPTDTTA